MPQARKRQFLVIISCTQEKIWDTNPTAGPQAAINAYKGNFSVSKSFAQKYTDRWLILSAKYGFIDPDYVIRENYSVTFDDPEAISLGKLRKQVRQKRLDKFSLLIALCSTQYREVIEDAFAGTSASLLFPVSGVGFFESNRLIKQATTLNDPFFRLAKPSKRRRTQATTHPRRRATSRSVDVSDNVDDLCLRLHQSLNRLPLLRFPFHDNDLPHNGIYIVFEDGERAHGTNRIVRIGTHTGDGQLRSRLNEHFLTENKDRSIFRKNIGRCLLRRADDPFLAQWDVDLTTRAAKKLHHQKINVAKQNQVERQVSEYVRSHLRFVVFEVPPGEDRRRLEAKLISTVSLCRTCRPSKHWLGLYSPKPKIRESGLWQEQELYKTPLSSTELSSLRAMLGGR